jgi:hypothetical protein
MKKFILLLSIIALFCQSAFAQTGGLNFQGVARNATGAVLANQKINLKFSILRTTETGTVEYTETKEVTTNAQGIFAVVVGEVNASSFASIDWKLSPKFLKVEMDPAGGTSFASMGTTRLQNVPYAYYANGVNANNIDGTISVAKGGTGATDAAAARTNLGLVIGTNVQAPLTAGTDYLTPSGNAATATKLATAKKINGVDFDGSSDISITATADASTLSGTVSVAKGGTGATTAVDARANLGLVIGTNVQAPLIAGTDYLTPTGNAATATKLAAKKKINGVDFDGSNDITIPTAADASTLSGTVSIAKGGTGATLAADARANLGAESIANKSTDIAADSASLTKYPSVKVIKDYVDTRVITGVSSSTDLTITSVNGLKLGLGGGRIETNVAVGLNALPSNSTGFFNTASGASTLSSNTTGSRNTASGAYALQLNTIGFNNTASGASTLSSNTTGSGNTASGAYAVQLNTIGFNNTASGAYALQSNSTGFFNTASGASTLSSNTTGSGNTASGAYALQLNTIGFNNTASGRMALKSNTVGSNNTATGILALYSNTTGSNNTASGSNALFSNTTGDSNTAVGLNTLYSNKSNIGSVAVGINSMQYADDRTTGRTTGNTAVGYESLKGSSTPANNTGQNNTAIGYQSLLNNTSGVGNTALGWRSLPNNTTGQLNSAFGQEALMDNTIGFANIAIGYQALAANVANSFNIAIGYYALRYGNNATTNNNGFNIAIGTEALRGSDTPANNTGGSNVSLGGGTLLNNSSGSNNTAVGMYSMSRNETGNNNTALGNGADVASANLSNATAIGNDAIVSASNSIQLGNTAITDVKTSGTITASGYKIPNGTSSQYLMADGTVSSGVASATSINGLSLGIGAGSNTSNIAVGGGTLSYNTTGSYNTASGVRALYYNTSGSFNTASGVSALNQNTTGIGNTADGYTTLYNNTTGSNNTASGFWALYSNTIGGNNTAIGYYAGSTNTTGENNTFIGESSNGSSATVSNSINLGNSSITTLRAQVTSITSLSDRRDKTDIVNISEGLDFLKQLRPVSFTWNTRDKAKVGIKSAGFIAQELLTLQKNSTIGDNLDLVSQDNPEKLEARYNNLLPVIVKAIQDVSNEKDKEIAELKVLQNDKISQLKTEKDKEIAELKARIQSLEVLINKVLEAKK